jgi:hypothetical protein
LAAAYQRRRGSSHICGEKQRSQALPLANVLQFVGERPLAESLSGEYIPAQRLGANRDPLVIEIERCPRILDQNGRGVSILVRPPRTGYSAGSHHK